MSAERRPSRAYSNFIARPISEVAIVSPHKETPSVLRLVDPFPSYPSPDKRKKPTSSRKNLNDHELKHWAAAEALGYEAHMELFASGDSLGRTYVFGVSNPEHFKLIAAASSHHKVEAPHGTGSDNFQIDRLHYTGGGLDRKAAHSLAERLVDMIDDDVFEHASILLTEKDSWTAGEVRLVIEKARHEIQIAKLLEGQVAFVVANNPDAPHFIPEPVQDTIDRTEQPWGYIDNLPNGDVEATHIVGGVIRKYCLCGGCSELRNADENHTCPAAQEISRRKLPSAEQTLRDSIEKPTKLLDRKIAASEAESRLVSLENQPLQLVA